MNSINSLAKDGQTSIPSISVQQRGWFNAFFPLMGSGNVDHLTAFRKSKFAEAREIREINSLFELETRKIKTDRYVVPFSLIIDSTISIDLSSGAIIGPEAYGLDGGWRPGPLPFEYFARDDEVRRWLLGESEQWPTGGRSDGKSRGNHFSHRTADQLYGNDFRFHIVLEEPIRVAQDLGMDVDEGISIWAIELLLASELNFESFTTEGGRVRSAEVVCHLEAVELSLTEVSFDDVAQSLYSKILTALEVLSRNPGKRDEQSFRINPFPSRSCNIQENASEGTPHATTDLLKRGRVHFHDALKKKLGVGEDGLALIKNCLLMDAYEPPSANKPKDQPGRFLTKRHVSAGSSLGTEELVGLDRRSYSLTVFPFVEGLVADGIEPTTSSSLGRAMAHCSDGDARRELLSGLMLNELISASTRVTDSRIRRAQNAPKQISGHIRYLCLRDGVSFVVDSTSDPYNTSVLAYTFGIRLDQFLLGRMTSRLLEQLGIVAGNKFDNVRGYTSGLKSLRKKDGIQENIDSVRHLDEDIVKVKGIYWHASSTGSVRSNELLQVYRDQQKDSDALELLEEKSEDLRRIVSANAESVDRAISRYTGSFYRFLAGLAFAVVLATQVVSHPTIEKWGFWPYLGLWGLLTVGFGLVSSGALNLIERRAISKYFERE